MPVLNVAELGQMTTPQLGHYLEQLLASNTSDELKHLLLDRLSATDNPSVQAGLAVALSSSYRGDMQVFDALVRLLNEDTAVEQRATLLQALRHFDCAPIFPTLLDIVLTQGEELAELACARLCELRVVDVAADDYQRFKTIRESPTCASWRKDLLVRLRHVVVDPLDEQAVEEFWNWFAANADALLSADGTDLQLYEDLDERFNRIATDLGWELGPYADGGLYFAVSPEMNANLVRQARQMLARCRQTASGKWHFCLGRQRRPWSDILQMTQTGENALAAINLSQWRFILYRVPGSTLLDIVFECGANCAVDDAELDTIAYLLATSLLGEMTVLERVDQIEVVRAFAEGQGRMAKPVVMLPSLFGMKPV